MPSKAFTIRLPENLHNQLKQIAEDKDVKVVQIIREACDQYIDNGAPSNRLGSHPELHDFNATSDDRYQDLVNDKAFLKDEIIKKNKLIESLTNGQLVHKTNNGFRPLAWIRGLLSSSSAQTMKSYNFLSVNYSG